MRLTAQMTPSGHKKAPAGNPAGAIFIRQSSTGGRQLGGEELEML
jgi:hypothetical protein